jgi:hypothetical protein
VGAADLVVSEVALLVFEVESSWRIVLVTEPGVKSIGIYIAARYSSSAEIKRTGPFHLPAIARSEIDPLSGGHIPPVETCPASLRFQVRETEVLEKAYL